MLCRVEGDKEERDGEIEDTWSFAFIKKTNKISLELFSYEGNTVYYSVYNIPFLTIYS